MDAPYVTTDHLHDYFLCDSCEQDFHVEFMVMEVLGDYDDPESVFLVCTGCAVPEVSL